MKFILNKARFKIHFISIEVKWWMKIYKKIVVPTAQGWDMMGYDDDDDEVELWLIGNNHLVIEPDVIFITV